MPRLANSIALRRLVLVLLLACPMLACQAAPPRPAGPSAIRESSPDPRSTGPSRDLSPDESAGGHTLRKHVGRSDEELRQRLRRERNLSAASTWTDRATAEVAIGIALELNRDRIERWANRSGGHPNFVIDYDSHRPLGRSLLRDADQPIACSHATIVLRWLPPHDYYVLTSYPECRS